MIESSWTFKPLAQYPPSERLSPVDWKLAVRAFDGYMCGLGGEAPYAGFPQAVAGLFGNAGQLLHGWAKERGARVLEPPPVETLLNGTAELWPELQNPGDVIFVIPSLERCFLRHFRGIRLARALVETVWAKPCRLVIGCDAWAWKYLRQAVQMDSLCPDAVTAAPLMAHCAESAGTPDITPRARDSRLQAYVLHTLLVHDGMVVSVLPQLLPFRATQIFKTLSDLRGRQLAFEEDGAWRVSPKHYAGIRRQLEKVEFWVA
ncbi:MAG: hypothetical protein KGI29_00185 [Pseudomonadota bacterium]|nr:hypothetical protein [Pseudomonadota bacterium]MDE3038921.1 hypothetical protein [Pseudomonadota bacterium]